jgi:hypothetical protein
MMNNYRILVSLMLFVVLPLTFPIGLVAVYASDPQIDQLIREELVREDAGDLQGAIEVNKKILSFDPKMFAP